MGSKQLNNETNLMQWHLALAGFVFGLIAIYCLNEIGRVYVHFAVTQFCHGVSSGKILFFLAYVGLLQLLFAFPIPLRNLQRLTGLFVGSIALAFAANLATYLIYLNAFNLGSSDITFHWREGINSVNSFTHIHTGKVAIAWAIEFLSWDSLHTVFDTGAAYLDVIPAYLAATIAIGFLVALVSSILIAPAIVTRYPRDERVIIGFIVSWILVSLCKCVLDGGPFSYDALASMILLRPILISKSTEEFFIQLKKQLPLYCLFLAAWMLVILNLQPGALGPQAERFMVRTSLLLVPLLALWVREAGFNKKRLRLVAITVAVCLVFAGVKRSAEVELLPLFRVAPSHLTLVGSFEAQGDQVLPIAKEQIATQDGSTILETYLTMSVSPYRCSTVSFANAEIDSVSNLVGRVLMPANNLAGLKFPEEDGVHIIALEPKTLVNVGDSQAEWIDCYLSVEYRDPLGISRFGSGMDQVQENERFFAYKLLDHHFRRSGLSQYILIPYGFLPTNHTESAKNSDNHNGGQHSLFSEL